MKEFLKYTFATVLGIIIAFSLLLIVGVMGLTGIALSSSGPETVVKESTVFTLDLNGTIKERYQASPLDRFLDEEITTQGLDDILASIHKAKNNPQIKGIYLNAGTFVCQPASLKAIRNALNDFKTSGKFIIAYGDAYSQSSYYLASTADEVIVNPAGTLSWHGLSSQTLFLKDLLDKIGVRMQIFRAGNYKSAVEPFTSSQMSEANREQTRAFVSSIWQDMLSNISESRNISTDSLNKLADQNMDFQPAETYIRTGLADTLMYKDEVLSFLKQLAGIKESDDLNTLTAEEMLYVPSVNTKGQGNDVIAVYYAYGEIDNGAASYEEGISSEQMIQDLKKLREDENIKAVVLRINSPGGSAYGSEQIWREVSLLKASKPVVVSMGDYAASGGYYISCAASCIVAEPTTLTGSIGVFGMIPEAQKLTEEKLGLHFDGIKTNRFADMGNITRPLNTDESQFIQQMVNQTYELFIKRCSEGRELPVEDLKKIAEGRVWTGNMAKELHLVDELGGINRAIDIAAEYAQIDNYTIKACPEKQDFLTSMLQMHTKRYIQSDMIRTFGNYYNGFLLLKNLKQSDYIQARIPCDFSIN